MDLRTDVVNQSKIKTSSGVTFEKGEETLWFAVPPPRADDCRRAMTGWSDNPCWQRFPVSLTAQSSQTLYASPLFPSKWHLCSFSKWNTRVVPHFSRLPQPQLHRTGIIWRGPLGPLGVKRFELDLQGSVAFSLIVQSASSCLCICFGAL